MIFDFDNRQNKVDFEKDLLLKLKEVADECLKYENWPMDVEVGLTFVDNDIIKQINFEYRNKNIETDVLSFPMFDSKVEISVEDRIIGDIVISLEKALEQSLEFNHSFEREVCFLLCHSMFHLMGYDHMVKEEEEIMFEKQEEVLNNLKIKR